jgi:hypothetical protein
MGEGVSKGRIELGYTGRDEGQDGFERFVDGGFARGIGIVVVFVVFNLMLLVVGLPLLLLLLLLLWSWCSQATRKHLEGRMEEGTLGRNEVSEEVDKGGTGETAPTPVVFEQSGEQVFKFVGVARHGGDA